MLPILFVPLAYAAAPRSECAHNLAPTTLETFFTEVERLREAGKDGRRSLDNFIFRSEFMAGLPGSATFTFTKNLFDGRRRHLTARTVLDRVMKAYARNHPDDSFAAPLFHSLSELEKHFDPNRVVELRLISELVDDVLNGLKTSSIRAHNVWDIKSGPAVFRVPNSAVTIPVVIESVAFRRDLLQIKDADLRAQGPFVAGILAREGRFNALSAVFRGMKQHYPGFTPTDDVTIVHFRLRKN